MSVTCSRCGADISFESEYHPNCETVSKLLELLQTAADCLEDGHWQETKNEIYQFIEKVRKGKLMAKDYDNTNRGVLFKNDEKKADNHPDYRGKINVNGTDFWLSSWLKTSKDGKKFMSLSVSPVEDKPQAKKPSKKIEEMDSDLPF